MDGPMEEVSPQYLRDGVEFQIKLRGYDPVQVDDFLDRVAGGIELLQQQLRQALERAARAEQQAAEHADADQTLRRTLVLAQRTADLTTREAEEHAARVRGDAEEHAAKVRTEAERAAEATKAEAGEQARRMAVEAERRIRAEIAQLEAARATLQGDIDALARYLDDERARVRGLLADQLERLDSLATTGVRPPPVRDVAIPPPPETAGPDQSGAGRVAGDTVLDDVDGFDREPGVDDDPAQADVGAGAGSHHHVGDVDELPSDDLDFGAGDLDAGDLDADADVADSDVADSDVADSDVGAADVEAADVAASGVVAGASASETPFGRPPRSDEPEFQSPEHAAFVAELRRSAESPAGGLGTPPGDQRGRQLDDPR